MTAHAIERHDFDPPGAAGAAARQYITFACAGQNFGIDIMSMREIRNFSPVTPLPAQKLDVLGVIDIRGRVIPIHDLALRIGCTTERRAGREGQVFLILLVNGVEMGLLVDSVSDIIEVKTEDMMAVPRIEGSAARFLAGIARQGEDLIAILDEATIQSYVVEMDTPRVDTSKTEADADVEFVFLDEA